MSEHTITRLFAVAVSAAALDQLGKLAIRAALAIGEQRHIGLGLALTRQAHTSAGSSAATFVVAGVFVLAGLLGGRLDRPKPPTWLTGGLLIGGAASAFVELAVVGTTLSWLSLPLHAVVSLAYLEMLVGGAGLFWHIGQSRRRRITQPPVVTIR